MQLHARTAEKSVRISHVHIVFSAIPIKGFETVSCATSSKLVFRSRLFTCTVHTHTHWTNKSEFVSNGCDPSIFLHTPHTSTCMKCCVAVSVRQPGNLSCMKYSRWFHNDRLLCVCDLQWMRQCTTHNDKTRLELNWRERSVCLWENVREREREGGGRERERNTRK